MSSLAGNSVPTWLQHHMFHFQSKEGILPRDVFEVSRARTGCLVTRFLHTCALPSQLDLLGEGKNSNAKMTLSNLLPTTLQPLFFHVCRDDGAPACVV